MPRRPPPRSDLPPALAELIAGMDLDELRAATAAVVDLDGARARRRMVPERVSRRRPRSEALGSVTVRLDLEGARPPVWRRVELPSSLHLDELHSLLQALFGWTDSHLHRFTQGASVWDLDVELFLCPYDLDEGEDDGVPTADVRLDEVLHEPGDQLRYAYDYGDDWTLDLVVEHTGPPVARPRCTDGAGLSPPEDSGGIAAWNDAPDDDLEPAVDVAALDERLGSWWREQQLPPALLELRRQLAGTPASALLQPLLDEADLAGAPPVVDELEATEMVRPYTWLLDRVGDGVQLTSAGWLPPALVVEAAAELRLDAPWMGKRNREERTPPVRTLRTSAQRLGLLRVHKGALLRTKAGAALSGDPVALWQHVAQRAAGAPRDPVDQVATVLPLLAVAAGRPRDTDLTGLLAAAGWRPAGGGPLLPWHVSAATADARAVLDAVGAWGDRSERWSDRTATPTSGGRALARRALQSLVP